MQAPMLYLLSMVCEQLTVCCPRREPKWVSAGLLEAKSVRGKSLRRVTARLRCSWQRRMPLAGRADRQHLRGAARDPLLRRLLGARTVGSQVRDAGGRATLIKAPSQPNRIYKASSAIAYSLCRARPPSSRPSPIAHTCDPPLPPLSRPLPSHLPAPRG